MEGEDHLAVTAYMEDQLYPGRDITEGIKDALPELPQLGIVA